MLYIAFCVFIILLLYYFVTRTFDHWKAKNVNGPKPIPLFGNLLEVALRRKHIGIFYKDIYEQFPDEKFVGIYRMTSPDLLIRDLDTVRQILIKDFDFFPERGIEFSTEKLGDNLFHCNADAWKALKSRLTPVFTSGKLRGMFQTFDECGERFTKYVEDVCMKQSEQDVHKLVMKYTIASVMSAFFGLDVDTYNDDSSSFSMIDNAIFTPSYKNEMSLLYPDILTKINYSLFPEIVHKFCREIVKTVINNRNGIPSTRCDFMDTFLSLKQNSEVNLNLNKGYNGGKEFSTKITDNTIASQVFIFYAAAYGNISLAISYAMYYLAHDIDVQDKLVSEIDRVLHKFNGKLTYDSIKEMKYLDMVFYETVRMHPLSSITRTANQDYRISADLTIDKGTTILVSPYAIQHDEKYYPNPEKFDPDRFLPENSGDRHSCAFLAFGAGPRGCLGLRFAKIQFEVCLVKLLSRFRIEDSGRTKPVNEFSPWRNLLTPYHGIHLSLIPRVKQNH